MYGSSSSTVWLTGQVLRERKLVVDIALEAVVNHSYSTLDMLVGAIRSSG